MILIIIGAEQYSFHQLVQCQDRVVQESHFCPEFSVQVASSQHLHGNTISFFSI
jgi:hypothetical protein